MRYSPKILHRARRAVRCSPFTLALFETMQHQSVPLGTVTGHTGCERGYVRYPITELTADRHAAWLIQTGLLRREVDGQGLTDSFRLTPLGRQLVHEWQQKHTPFRTASVIDRVFNWVVQWVRWPTWLT